MRLAAPCHERTATHSVEPLRMPKAPNARRFLPCHSCTMVGDNMYSYIGDTTLAWTAPHDCENPCGKACRPAIAGRLRYRADLPGKSTVQRPLKDIDPNKRSLAAAHRRRNEPRNAGTRDPAKSSATGRKRSAPDSRTIVTSPWPPIFDLPSFKSRQVQTGLKSQLQNDLVREMPSLAGQ